MSATITPSRGPVVAGVAAMAPLVVAYAPFALVIGGAAATLDDPLAGWAGSWLVFGGSAQLAAIKGIHAGAPLLAVVTALLVNARLLVYAASLGPRWRDQPRWFRALAPAMLIDPTWALADRHLHGAPSPAEHRRYYLGAALTLGSGWSAAVAIGVLLGARLPATGFHLAAPLCLVGMVGPRLRDRRHRWAALAAAAVAVLGAGWPGGTGTAAAIVAGATAAALTRSSRS